MTNSLPVVVPAIPPRPPQITLLGSAIRPQDAADPSINGGNEITPEQLAALPEEQRREIEARAGAAWTRGFAYAPENHSAATVRAGCDGATVDDPASHINLPPVEVVPYLVLAGDTCSTFGFDERDYKGRALRLLENATPQAIEHEFWTGTLAQADSLPNNYLVNASSLTDVTPVAGPVSVARGLQLLQDALAGCGFGGQGMIHTMPQTTPNLLGARRVGSLLLDIFDNIIVPGVGYPGTGPSGAAPAAGTAWMYATDLVAVRVEDEGTVFPETFAQAVKRGTNDVTFRAEKFAAAYFDGACHFAVHVTLPS